MNVSLDTRTVESSTATEIYISAAPVETAPPQELAREIFAGIREILRAKNASIFQERVFGTQQAMEIAARIRAEKYGDIDDGVAPSFLVGKKTIISPIAGVQVHAICSDSKPEPISIDAAPCGRVLHLPDRTFLALSGVSALQPDQPTDQARQMLEKAESALKQFGADISSVSRTWMWLGDILAWYDDFNKIRNEFFTERGILGKGTRQSMPASTGIGLGPADGGSCSMDLTAVLQPSDSIRYIQAAGKQQCAFDYGSAFSRASRAPSPAGQTIFVSGTASIDTSGATTNIGDAAGQISTSIKNVQAVLRDLDCPDEDTVQVVAYCRTAEVERVFNTLKDVVPWPWLTAIGDICREDLLFEMEAAAIPRR